MLKVYSDSLYVSCVDEAARYHTAKYPNGTFMYVFEHRSKKSEKPEWMGRIIFQFISRLTLKFFNFIKILLKIQDLHMATNYITYLEFRFLMNLG